MAIAPEPKKRKRWASLVLAAALAVAVAFYFVAAPSEPGSAISFSTFTELVAEDAVARITVRGLEIEGTLKTARDVEGRTRRTFTTTLPAPPTDAMLALFRDHGVRVAAEEKGQSPIASVVFGVLPWVLFLGLMVWGAGRLTPTAMAGAPTSRRGIGEPIAPGEVKARFDDVAGAAAAKRDLAEVVEFLKAPERFTKVGARVPRGVLLIGPPGTGKTLLARAVAGEAGVPFFSMSGSEFIELFVGLGAARVRELFTAARKAAPCIVFVDEIDAVGRARGTGLGGGHDEREQTLNQLLAEMDGFDREERVIVLAATNRPDVLDAALLRPGRFDRRVVLELPERAARLAILKVHAKGKPLAPDVDLDALAGLTIGASGADLANLLNEAAIAAARAGATAITAAHVTSAHEKILLGDPREGPLRAEERKRVAFHEAGHALVAVVSPGADPVRRVSILPRGRALGATQQLPADDRHLVTRSELETRLRVLLGGRAAEMLVFGEPSTGAADDLRQAMRLAVDMVAHFGMSDGLGPVFYDFAVDHPFLGQRLALDGTAGEAARDRVDAAAAAIVAEAAKQATSLLEARRAALGRVAGALLEHESLEAAEIDALIRDGRALLAEVA